MTSSINHITVDAADPYAQSLFWAEALGLHEEADDPNLPDHDECLVRNASGSVQLLFIRVPEGKVVKNRVHLDIKPDDTTRNEEVERMLALGAAIVDDRRLPDGRGWVVLADPEGNEFCVERSDAERAASA